MAAPKKTSNIQGYQFTKSQKILYLLVGGIGISIISVLFYFAPRSEVNATKYPPSYKKALDQAILEASIQKPTKKTVNTKGCYSLTMTGNRYCFFDAYLYFPKSISHETYKQYIIGKEWQDVTVHQTLIPNEKDTYNKTINGVNVCLRVNNDLSKNVDSIKVHIDLANCQPGSPKSALNWAGWAPLLPSKVPLRYNEKFATVSYSTGEVTIIYKDGTDSYMLRISQHKIPSPSPPANCPLTKGLDSEVQACRFFRKTPNGNIIYGQTYATKIEAVYQVVIENTYIQIFNYGSSEQVDSNKSLTLSELDALVDSFSPTTLSEIESMKHPK